MHKSIETRGSRRNGRKPPKKRRKRLSKRRIWLGGQHKDRHEYLRVHSVCQRTVTRQSLKKLQTLSQSRFREQRPSYLNASTTTSTTSNTPASKKMSSSAACSSVFVLVNELHLIMTMKMLMGQQQQHLLQPNDAASHPLSTPTWGQSLISNTYPTPLPLAHTLPLSYPGSVLSTHIPSSTRSHVRLEDLAPN
jgi:hypothetical protein